LEILEGAMDGDTAKKVLRDYLLLYLKGTRNGGMMSEDQAWRIFLGSLVKNRYFEKGKGLSISSLREVFSSLREVSGKLYERVSKSDRVELKRGALALFVELKRRGE
jgi:hypothetical protein